MFCFRSINCIHQVHRSQFKKHNLLSLPKSENLETYNIGFYGLLEWLPKCNNRLTLLKIVNETEHKNAQQVSQRGKKFIDDGEIHE